MFCICNFVWIIIFQSDWVLAVCSYTLIFIQLCPSSSCIILFSFEFWSSLSRRKQTQSQSKPTIRVFFLLFFFTQRPLCYIIKYAHLRPKICQTQWLRKKSTFYSVGYDWETCICPSRDKTPPCSSASLITESENCQKSHYMCPRRTNNKH